MLQVVQVVSVFVAFALGFLLCSILTMGAAAEAAEHPAAERPDGLETAHRPGDLGPTSR